jgi:hypothetical protein
MFQGNLQVKGYFPHAILGRGMAWGLIGGLAGMMVMDILLMGALAVAGLPAFTCFSIVGNTAARFFSTLGMQMAGGVLTGVATHYLIGPLVGALFGLLTIKVGALRVDTLKKCIGFAVLYVEILAQPILASTPILLKMTAAETVQWFSGSFVMHFIFGVVLGVVVSYGLRLSVAVNHSSFSTKPGLNYSP